MTDEEKENVDRFFVEYDIILRIPEEEVLPSDVIVPDSEVTNANNTSS